MLSSPMVSLVVEIKNDYIQNFSKIGKEFVHVIVKSAAVFENSSNIQVAHGLRQSIFAGCPRYF